MDRFYNTSPIAGRTFKEHGVGSRRGGGGEGTNHAANDNTTERLMSGDNLRGYSHTFVGGASLFLWISPRFPRDEKRQGYL